LKTTKNTGSSEQLEETSCKARFISDFADASAARMLRALGVVQVAWSLVFAAHCSG
jgi:hypothetical protein